MDLDQFKSDRDALEQLIRTQLKGFIEKYQADDIDVTVTSKQIETISRIVKLVDVNVKIKMSI